MQVSGRSTGRAACCTPGIPRSTIAAGIVITVPNVPDGRFSSRTPVTVTPQTVGGDRCESDRERDHALVARGHGGQIDGAGLGAGIELELGGHRVATIRSDLDVEVVDGDRCRDRDVDGVAADLLGSGLPLGGGVAVERGRCSGDGLADGSLLPVGHGDASGPRIGDPEALVDHLVRGVRAELHGAGRARSSCRRQCELPSQFGFGPGHHERQRMVERRCAHPGQEILRKPDGFDRSDRLGAGGRRRGDPLRRNRHPSCAAAPSRSGRPPTLFASVPAICSSSTENDRRGKRNGLAAAGARIPRRGFAPLRGRRRTAS